MYSEDIYKRANGLINRYSPKNMFELADYLNIECVPQGNFNKLLAVYLCKWKKRYIIFNENLDSKILNMVIAHEIGHDQLHRYLAKNGIQEFSLMDITNPTEYEANVFASHLLIPTDRVLSLAHEGYTEKQISAQLNCDKRLTQIKLTEMRKLGYQLNETECLEKDFLKYVNMIDCHIYCDDA